MSDVRTDGMAARVIAAVGLVIATVIHVMVASGFGGTLSVLFVLSGLGTLAGAVLLFVRPWWGWLIGGGVAGLTAIGYILRSTVGLPPLIPNAVGFWRPTSGGICTIVEILVALLALWVLAGDRARTGRVTAAGR